MVIPSTAWEQGVPEDEFRERVDALTETVNRLRRETQSGWVGRQDDRTGYLAELSGGRFAGSGGDPEQVATELVDEVGPDLFGISGDGIAWVSSEPSGRGAVALRGEQRAGGLEVLDGALVATVADASGQPRVTGLRGLVFPGLEEVETAPAIPAERAATLAARAGQGVSQGEPRLIVVPLGESGALAWEVTVVSGEDTEGLASALTVAQYYIDAARGSVLSVRADSPADGSALADVTAIVEARRFAGAGPGMLRSTRAMATRALRTALAAAGKACSVTGNTVEVTGTSPLDEPLTGQGLRNGNGVFLADTTVPSFDPATGNGAICTFDAGQLSDESGLPGTLARRESPTGLNKDSALAAHVFARFVVDYYREAHGRNSWDGEGGTLTSAVDFPEEPCNAFFSGSLNPPQMVYGVPCVINGVQQKRAQVDVDTAGHEITHGVTDSSSDLIYAGQSGALNESFSDYFGNVIGDLFRGRDSGAYGEGPCTGLEPNFVCLGNPDGTASVRYLPNGATMEDYAYLLNVPISLSVVDVESDHGGVHINSAVWNNSLWSIRMQLAETDGVPMFESERAKQFDRIVYGALTRHLTQTSGFIDARAAIEQVAVEEGADATTFRIIRQTFDRNEICAGCAEPPHTEAIPVATTSTTQQSAALSTEGVGWVELSVGEGVIGVAAFGSKDGNASPVTGRPDAWSVGFAGDKIVAAEDTGFQIAMYDVAAGTSEVLDTDIGDGVVTGVASSREGAAWMNFGESSVNFVTPEGEVTSADYGTSDPPYTIGTGGGTVVTGAIEGTVVAWEQGGRPSILEQLEGAVFAVDAHGDKVVAVSGVADEPATVTLFDLTTDESTVLSTNAAPFGVSISDQYVVWSDITGILGGTAIELARYTAFDTDLHMYSLASGGTFKVMAQRGQQGFPVLDGRELLWQDTVLGGDDLFTGTLPEGL